MLLLGVRVALRSSVDVRRFAGVLGAACLKRVSVGLRAAGVRGRGVLGKVVLGRGEGLGVEGVLGFDERCFCFGGDGVVDSLMGVRGFVGEPAGVVESLLWTFVWALVNVRVGVFAAALGGVLTGSFERGISASALLRSSSCHSLSLFAMSTALAYFCS